MTFLIEFKSQNFELVDYKRNYFANALRISAHRSEELLSQYRLSFQKWDPLPRNVAWIDRSQLGLVRLGKFRIIQKKSRKSHNYPLSPNSEKVTISLSSTSV